MKPTRRSFLTGGILAGATVTVGLDTTVHTPRAVADALPRDAWQSNLLRTNPHGKLSYPRRGGLRLPDWGHVGYRQGQTPPNVPVVSEIAPTQGDNTAHIQSAIDQVGTLPKQADGFRGAILLKAGDYPVAGTLYLRHDGVVLRGEGSGEDSSSNTVLRATGNTPEKRDVLNIGGGTGQWNGDERDWLTEVPGTRTNITTDYVPLAGTSFTVADASMLSVGDNIIIVHPCSQDWLDAIDGGGTNQPIGPPWRVDSQPITFNRFITQIRGNRVSVDAPIHYQLDRSLTQSFIYKWDRANLITDVGVEDLRIHIEYSGDPLDENHAWNAIRLIEAEDAWVRDTTVRHYGMSGIGMYKATRITISGCQALDPVSLIAGSRRYAFNAERSTQQVLVTNCYANLARHAYVSNGTSTASGLVFHRCTAEDSLTSSEGHRRWTQGILFDNHKEINPNPGSSGIILALLNRGSGATQHGWAAVHSVAWAADVADATLSVQQAPTGQNYAIGCFGTVSGAGYSYSDPDATVGYIEGTNRLGLNPPSLYEAQKNARSGRVR
ncbi:hypothetical protein GCM10027403_21690 [Arthrobacter tecti]